MKEVEEEESFALKVVYFISYMDFKQVKHTNLYKNKIFVKEIKCRVAVFSFLFFFSSGG